MAKTIVILGARNLGGAILEHFLGLGWRAAAVARSEDTLAAVRDRGALALPADAADRGELAGALDSARAELGSLDAVVNAVSASRPSGGPFGGGELAEADLAAFRGWTVAVAEQAFVFLSAGAAALRAGGRGGALIQITGGSSRRAMPGKGLWAAGAFATRALVQAAAQELRTEGIHAALLAIDATIESPKTAGFTRDAPPDGLADMRQVAGAVAFLVEQGARALTHELVVTPAGERWVP
ncbi:MAG: SDR family NAD(P)-dependent oxidoreductase [Solirubrobacterales bacterium]|nr:SDR family NAD(P)-dependent oxidoreductase [Solirubrobacterales bacterium]MBV9715418.1 SDR family NAD(P)-dependent oxidoreductase [Solirubrobacterales bacterium]